MDFCKEYNAAHGEPARHHHPVEITIFEDRTFTFVTKTPPAPVLMRQAAGLPRARPPRARPCHREITDAQLTEIAKIKLPDLNANDLEAAKRRSPAPPARWASASSADDRARHAHAATPRASSEPATAGRPRPCGLPS
jgi:hypothetical protein